MPVFQNNGGILTQIEETAGLVEKDVQKLIENNLDTLLRLTFIQSEYNTGKMHGGRIDTVALEEADPEPIFVIMEYKNKRDKNVLIQAIYYFGWAKDHEDAVIKLAQSRGIKNAHKIDVSKTKIICIDRKFTKEEIYVAAILNTWCNFDIQLLVFTLQDDIFTIDTATHSSLPVCKSNGSGRPLYRIIKGDLIDESIVSVERPRSPVKALVTRLIDPEWKYHDLFNMFSEYALSFDDIEIHDNTEYIGFRKLYNLFVVKGYQDYMKVIIDLNKYKDNALIESITPYVESYPRDLFMQVESKYKKDGLLMEFMVKESDHLQQIFPIIKLVCENF